MGGVGSGGRSSMQGIGSDPNYSRSSSAGSNFDVDSLVSGFGAMASSVVSQDNINAVKSTGASFWGSLTAGASAVATAMTEPQENDGLADLQRQVSSQKPMQSKYGGFGSDNSKFSSTPQPAPSSFGSASPSVSASSGAGSVDEAPGLPGEDRNGIARLTGETDEQYVKRQTRLRDEARARMAAKFGGSAMSSASSGSSMGSPSPAPKSNGSVTVQEAPGLPGEDRNGIQRLTGESDEQYVVRQTRLKDEAKARMAAKFGGGGSKMGGVGSSAPSSGNSGSWLSQPPAGGTPNRKSSGGGSSINSGDFFSSFGT